MLLQVPLLPEYLPHIPHLLLDLQHLLQACSQQYGFCNVTSCYICNVQLWQGHNASDQRTYHLISSPHYLRTTARPDVISCKALTDHLCNCPLYLSRYLPKSLAHHRTLLWSAHWFQDRVHAKIQWSEPFYFYQHGQRRHHSNLSHIPTMHHG